VTNFIFAFIFLCASHVFRFSLFPFLVISSRADLAVPVLWPQPFLVIIPQPVATSSDQCVGGKNVAIRVIQTAPRSRPPLQSLAAQHLVQRQFPPPRVDQEVRSERKDCELLSCWSTPLDSGPRSALSCPC